MATAASRPPGARTTARSEDGPGLNSQAPLKRAGPRAGSRERAGSRFDSSLGSSSDSKAGRCRLGSTSRAPSHGNAEQRKTCPYWKARSEKRGIENTRLPECGPAPGHSIEACLPSLARQPIRRRPAGREERTIPQTVPSRQNPQDCSTRTPSWIDRLIRELIDRAARGRLGLIAARQRDSAPRGQNSRAGRPAAPSQGRCLPDRSTIRRRAISIRRPAGAPATPSDRH